ncbi:MAG: TfoX/Sxy family protein [Methanomicrobiales archaeon]|nr:TfoX/Sxy family protein [Methanomicrobiales archaeon]
MAYYVEAESKLLREKFEAIVLGWEGVTKKTLFGSPSYAAGSVNFAMLVTGGIVLTRLDEEQRDRLLEDPNAGYFAAHGRIMKRWVRISIGDVSEIERYLPWITASYAAARGE